MAARAQAGLPPGWEWDYDGSRWLYRYKSTGHEQYHFPTAGDEFPDYVDRWAPPPDLAPEERLESQQQVRRHAGRHGRLLRLQEEEDQDEEAQQETKKGDHGQGRGQGGGVGEEDEEAEKRRARRLWAARMSAVARPVSSLLEEPRAVRVEDKETGGDGASRPASLASLGGTGSLADVSPLAEGRLSAGFSDEGTLVATQDLEGTLSSLMVEVGGRGEEAAVDRRPFDPVGLMAEMATEQTARAKIELFPDPIEMADNSVLAPIETQSPPGAADVRGRQREGGSSPQQRRWEEVEWRRQESLEELLRFVDVRCDIQALDKILSLVRRPSSGTAEATRGSGTALGTGQRLARSLSRREPSSATSSAFSSPLTQTAPALPLRIEEAGELTTAEAEAPPEYSTFRSEKPESHAGDWGRARSVSHAAGMVAGEGTETLGDPAPPTNAPGNGGGRHRAQTLEISSVEPSPLISGALPTTHGRPADPPLSAAMMPIAPKAVRDSPTLGSHSVPDWQHHQRHVSEPERESQASPGSNPQEEERSPPRCHSALVEPLNFQQASAMHVRHESNPGPVHPDPWPPVPQSRQTSVRPPDEGSSGVSFQELVAAAFARRPTLPPQPIFVQRRPARQDEFFPPPPSSGDSAPSVSPAASYAATRPSEHPTGPPPHELDWLLSPASQEDADGLDLYLDTVYPPAVSPLLPASVPSPLNSDRALPFSSAETLAASSSTTLSQADGPQDRAVPRPQTPYHSPPSWLPEAEIVHSPATEAPQPIPEKHPMRPSMLYPQQYAIPPAGPEPGNQAQPDRKRGGDEPRIDQRQPSPNHHRPEPLIQKKHQKPSVSFGQLSPPLPREQASPPAPFLVQQGPAPASPQATSPRASTGRESKKIYQRLSLPPMHARLSLSSNGEKRSSGWTKWFKPSRLNRQSVAAVVPEISTKIYSPVDIPPPPGWPAPYTPRDLQGASPAPAPAPAQAHGRPHQHAALATPPVVVPAADPVPSTRRGQDTLTPEMPRAMKGGTASGHRKGDSGSISPASANSSIRPSGDFSVLRPSGHGD